MPIRAGILTISDKASRGERADTSGPAIAELLASIDATVARSEVVPDERPQIARTLSAWADSGELDVIVTTGGTGLAPRDVTPEATADAIERPVPGLGELMRAAGVQHTPLAALSRGVAGVRGRCLILNLPGSERGARENLSAVIDLLPHAVELLRGAVGDHPAPIKLRD
ncbi:MAG: MogA/MoaB family molybdenum cofactor biosynthesis protein [Chloroflexi bacterium]|nr:MogA/MoaB family molybdenum cofactor biosynthesis protein [Chloroflexota bacterium]